MPRDRGARGRLGLDGHAVHEHVDVRSHQARRCDEHERGDEKRSDRVGVWKPPRTSSRPTSTAAEPSRSLKKCSAFDSSAALSSLARRAPGDERAARVDDDHDDDDDERVPRCVDLRVAMPASRWIARNATKTLASTRIAPSASAARCSAFPWP